MPEISAHTAAVQSVAPPTPAAGASAASDDSHNNQPFDNVLQSHLSDKPGGKTVDESTPPSDSVPATVPVLAVDGKDLPPDIAALIAASQPVVAEQATVVSPADINADPVGDETSRALASTTLPAALAALSAGVVDAVPTNGLAVLRDSRSAVDTAAKLTAGTKGFLQADEHAAVPGPGTVLVESASFDSDQPGTPLPAAAMHAKEVALAEAASVKDSAPLLRDARDGTPPTPSTTTMVAAGGMAPSSVTPLAVPSTPLPFAQPGWEQGVGNRVMWMVNQQVQTAELRMNPAHLGPLEVRISIRDDQASVSFISAHGQVRDALQAAIPHLREMLNDNGLNLADVNIAQHSFANARQGSDDTQSRAGGGRGQAAAGESHTETLLPMAQLGLIDYYA